MHRGVVPPGTATPLHLLLLLDLGDPACPVKAEGGERYLPLYYPLKYGWGGAEVQYSVLSDSEIKIVRLSDDSPGPPDEQYVQVSELPSSPVELLPLSPEEASEVGFAEMILVGGDRDLHDNAGTIICHNPACRFHQRPIDLRLIATIPPVPVNGASEFWHEYEGGHMEFCFGLCPGCLTVIAFNVAT